MTFLQASDPFPQATSSFPTLAPAPLFPLTRDEEEVASLIPNLFAPPTATSSSLSGMTGRSAANSWLAGVTGGVLGTDNDAAGWSPDEAAAQTDRALARIAQANPELAQQLAASRGKSEGEDLPWYKDILKGVGDVLHATKLDVVFDYLGRASHILPEVVLDWGKESAWTNAWQAISGEEKTNWNEVFQSWGWEGGGIGGFARAALGLVGDIATDPLTYLTFGAGAVGRSAAAKTTSIAAVEAALKEGSIGVRTLETVTEAGTAALRYGDETVDLGVLIGTVQKANPEASLNDIARGIVGFAEGGQALAEKGGAGLLSRIRAGLGMAHPDARPGIGLVLEQMAAGDALRQTIRLADDVARASTTVGWQRVTADAARAMGVEKGVVDDVLRSYVSQGTGHVGKTAYRFGKEAAASLGGARLRFSIPVLDIRAAGWKLPMLPARMDFSIGRRFFAGLSGQVKLMKLVGEGAATMEDMRYFWEGGWKKLNELSPGVARQVGRGTASMYYTAAEGVGKATQIFSPHHKQLRGGGLSARYAGEVSNQSKHIGTQTIDEMQTITLQGGAVVRPSVLLQRLGVAVKAAGPENQVELGDTLNELINLVPESGVTANKYWEDRISKATLVARARGEEGTDEFQNILAEMRDKQDKAVRAEKRVAELSGGDQDIAELWRGVSRNRDDIEVAAGLTPDQYNGKAMEASNLHPDDAAEYSDGVVYTSPQVSGDAQDVGESAIVDNGVTGVPLRGVRGVRRGTLGDSLIPAPKAAEAVEAENELMAGLRASLGVESGAAAKEQGQDILARSRAANDVREGATNGTMHVIGSMDPDLAAAVQHNLDALEPGELQYIVEPQMVVTGPRRTLTIDRRTQKAGQAPEATHVIDEVEEIQAAYRPILDEVEAGTLPELDNLPDDVADDIRDIVTREGGKEAQLADLTTVVLKQRGYTDVRILTDDAEEVVTFWDEAAGATGFTRVNPRAARLAAHGGSQLRALTPQVREAVMGAKNAKGNRIINRILRATKNQPRGEAEKAARRILAEEQIVLRPSQAVFETNPVRILEEASNATAAKVQQEFVGQAMRHGENLGLLRGGYGAGYVGMGKFRVVLNEGETAIGTIAEAGTARRQAEEVVARLADKQIPALEAAAKKYGDEATAAAQALDAIRQLQETRVQAALYTLNQNTMRYQSEGFLDDRQVGQSLAARGAELNELLEHGTYGGQVRGTLSRTNDANIWRYQDNEGFTTYYFVNDEGTVVGSREVAAPMSEELWRLHEAVPYSAESAQMQRTILALTGPEARGQGVGSRLLDADWADRGITSGTFDEQFRKMSEAIAANTFTEAGNKLNQSAIKRHANRIQNEAKAAANKLKTQADQKARELELANIQLQNDQNELMKLRARATNNRAPLLAALVPAENAANMTGMSALKVPGFEELAMPTFMAEEFERGLRGFPKLTAPHQAFRQLNNFWKQFATWLVPGFHIRNLQGAFFNNWLGGVGIRDYVHSARIRYAEREIARGNLTGKWASRRIRDVDPELLAGIKHGNPWGYLNGVKVDDLTYADLASMTAGLNINASNGRAFAEAMLTAEEQTRRVQKAVKGGRKSFVKRIPSPYTKLMRGTGTMTENWMRGAAWIRGLREGRSVMESRAFTMMRHGDYEDMTDAEFLWVRDLIPFYKWMRTNTPFQVHQLLESPGKLLAVQKAQRAVYNAQGLDYEKEKHRMPSWMTEGFTVPYNIGEEEGQSVFDTVMLDLPMSDLFMGGREFISSFLPTVRPFLESYLYHQQTFSGKPLEGKQVPVNPLFGPLLPVMDAVGLVNTGPDGQRYMSDRTQNLLGVIPLYSRFKNFIFEDGKSTTRRANMVASGVFGIQLRPVDLQSLTEAELNFYYDQVLPTVEYLRGVGYELPTTQDLEGTIGTTDTILQSLGIQPGLTPSSEAT